VPSGVSTCNVVPARGLSVNTSSGRRDNSECATAGVVAPWDRSRTSEDRRPLPNLGLGRDGERAFVRACLSATSVLRRDVDVRRPSAPNVIVARPRSGWLLTTIRVAFGQAGDLDSLPHDDLRASNDCGRRMLLALAGAVDSSRSRPMCSPAALRGPTEDAVGNGHRRDSRPLPQRTAGTTRIALSRFGTTVTPCT